MNKLTLKVEGMDSAEEAAMIHRGPDILVFLNSIKLLRVRIEPRK